MAISSTSICNQALSYLGVQALLDVATDNSPVAQMCRDNYDNVRDALIEEYPWTFATRRARLLAEANAPDFGYSYSFIIPRDALRVLDAFDSPDSMRGELMYSDWTKEKDRILADVNVLYIRYIARVTDVSLFTPAFIQAFSTRLAAEMALPLTQNTGLKNDLYQLYMMKMEAAQINDGMQGRTRVLQFDSITRRR